MPASDNASICAVVSAAGGHIALADVPRPTPGPGEALVKVAAISLNRGEVKTALESAPGTRRGWDFAGTVLEAASNGSGPAVGTRVVGIAPVGGWAELLAVNPVFIAPLPDTISFETAAALPVAGLTAHHCLAKGPQQAGRRRSPAPKSPRRSATAPTRRWCAGWAPIMSPSARPWPPTSAPST
jgi:NADPH:quinone reductase-like Zn-dependent oxidoreductase